MTPLWLLIIVVHGQVPGSHFVGMDQTPVIYAVHETEQACHRELKNMVKVGEATPAGPLLSKQCFKVERSVRDE